MRRLVGIIVLVSLFFAPAAAAQKGSSQHLPADLLYVGVGDVEGTDTRSPNVLMRLDAKTLTSSVFYYDPSLWLGLVPLAWSPNGSYLAVLQEHHGDETMDLCLITRAGALHHCFERVVNENNYVNRGVRQLLYQVTWSEDEQFIYFYREESDRFRLVEADTASGETIQVLYELTIPPDSSTALYWPQSLAYIVTCTSQSSAARLDGASRPYYVYDVEVVSRDARGDFNEVTDISSLVESNTSFCAGISPDGTKLAAVHYADNGYPELWFLDATGQVVEAVSTSYFEAQNISSVAPPSWQRDSSAVYFWGFSQMLDGSEQSPSLYRYVLGAREPVKLIGNEAFGFRHALGMGNYLVVAPDASAVAFNYVLQSVPVELAVATADGAVLCFDEIKPVMPQLLWFPENE
ncbi:MAG TPA: hypothetical protein PKD09_17120 [Aggregatilinea sp.]|uniref:hypothetical protein n=1 Tax=Aggregatilinea sp. TaxID=2806333 RepID=UPI002B88FBF4|nr:hypothetical protein [Aggregatilinea sp.]HML23380.1 hypothetical protein [Aggregatilinea sp.]